MNKKVKLTIIILVVIIISCLIMIVGLIKGGFNFKSFSGSLDNMTTKCLSYTLSDEGNLTVKGAVPIKDEQGKVSEPYKYTIENKCKREVEYFTVLNVMEGTNLENLSKIKVYLTGDSTMGPKFESELLEVQNVDGSGKDVLKSYKLDEGTLNIGEKKSFEFRTWIDYNVKKIDGTVVNKIAIKQFEQ